MKTRKSLQILTYFSVFALLSSCSIVKGDSISVMLEEGDYTSANRLLKGKRGEDFTFEITLKSEKAVFGTSYSDYSLSEEINEFSSLRYVSLTFHEVRYDTVITLKIDEAGQLIYSCGEEEAVETINRSHLRVNVSNDFDRFKKDGYKLCGYENEGELVSLGSRVSIPSNGRVSLSPLFIKETDPNDFSVLDYDDKSVSIISYNGLENHVCIPEAINGKRVIAIEEGAFQEKTLEEVILPKSALFISKGAFSSCDIASLVLFDSLETISDESFLDCEVGSMRVNATRNPGYLCSYFGTYADKTDRLDSLKDKKKIILYSGSSTRFGFQSPLLDQAFPDYEVVNMGVYAYTESLPQLDVILDYVKEGDVLIVSPEFDTLETQLNLDDSFDYAFFAMAEANYDVLRHIEPSHYKGFFSSFGEFLTRRKGMEGQPYSASPNQFDEDGNRVNGSSYNAYGDYSLFRENNLEGKSFGVRRAYYNKAHFPESDIALFNKAYRPFKEKGVKVFYDYSPRMDISLSEDSNEESVQELGTYLGERIDMPFLSSIQDSLLPPLYFHATDNHLSSEGAKKRSEFVIEKLKTYLE